MDVDSKYLSGIFPLLHKEGDITDGDTMYTYVKADGAKYTWEDAMRDYGNREYDSISDDAYVVEIRCKENTGRINEL